MSGTGEYLRSVTIGERKPHNDTIHLETYDENWPRQFERLAVRVHRALSAKVLLLEHVGSTSVPGLSAKPVIDMILVVRDSADEAAYVPALESEGFVLRIREPDWFEHRLLKAPEIAGNLHVFSEVKRSALSRAHETAGCHRQYRLPVDERRAGDDVD